MRRTLLAPVVSVIVVAVLAAPSSAAGASFRNPPYSSPITTSVDGRFIWSVNPGADTVSVISTRTNRVVQTIRVGDQPESVALDTRNRYAFVANAAASTVWVIRLSRVRGTSLRARVLRRFTTGAEPWNLVASRDGRRIFVANSIQNTITVIDALRARIIGHVDLARGRCALGDRNFQPRGLAVTANNRRLYVTSFLAFTRPGHRQADDTGREGLVCRLNINTRSRRIRAYTPARAIRLAPRLTGFTIDRTGDGVPDNTSAFPNQLQSVVIRGDRAYLPNIAASPDGPLRFNVDTHAFVQVIDGIRGRRERDAPDKGINLHLGARNPEVGKSRLFFANPWAIAFVRGGGAYVVSAGSDLLVKVLVGSDGRLVNTVDADTTRYIDLADPADPQTAGTNAGRNPQGIAVNLTGTRAYVMNRLSGNVSVVDTTTDRVVGAIRTGRLPAPGSREEVVNVGAQMFFGSRGQFDRPAAAAVSTSERLSSEGWQSCSSCHFMGLTDGVVWEFGAGPRKSVPLNATFAPPDKSDQRILNYSAIFDEVEDFEANIRNVSGPGPLAAPVPCATAPPPASTLDPNHGLLIGDDGNLNAPPCVLNAFAKPNAERRQVTVTLPGSSTAVPALTALREWVRSAVRTPNGRLPRRGSRPGDTTGLVVTGRRLFQAAGCQSCHGGSNWTSSRKDFTSPPPAPEIATETVPPPTMGAPVGLQYLPRFLRDIGSFNRGVPGAGNDLGRNIGATEKAAAALVTGVSQAPPDALGIDYNGDGKGNGYNPPSLLGIFAVPPYYHNGACEDLACVVTDLKHRTASGRSDLLASARARRAVVAYLRSLDADSEPVP